MSNLTKFAIAIVLGIVAAGINFVAVTTREEPPKDYYLAARADIKKGDLFSDDPTKGNLSGVVIPGDPASVSKSFIPWRDLGILLGTKATRDYTSGDLILYRDREEYLPQKRELGPFRLLSVGEQFTGEIASGSFGGGSGSTVTVAVKVIEDELGHQVYEAKALRLLEIIESQQQRGSTDSRLKIIALQIYPQADLDLPSTSGDSLLPLAQDERAIIVPLQGVTSLRAPLLVGQNIGFVLPE